MNAFSELTTAVPANPVFPIAGPVESAAPVVTKPSVPQEPRLSPPLAPSADTLVPLQRWAHANGFGGPTRVSAPGSPSYAIQSTNGMLVLHPGSALVRWDGLEVRLGFAPQLIDNQPYAHSLDLYKTIQPLLEGEPPPGADAQPVIVIDPGHGGENAGAKSVLNNRYEKEFTLDWALRLQALLEAGHCRVFLTRSNDTDLALSNRVAFAVQHRADVFVSLHFNSAAPNETESGLETYCLTPAGMPSSLTRGFADEVGQSFPNNAFDAQNLLLALRIHRALLEVNGHRDRGIRHARFPGVLRGQQGPAVLVEGGYLSNPQEARRIEDPAYRQKLAEALARALLPKSAAPPMAALLTEPKPDAQFLPVVPVADTGTNAEVLSRNGSTNR